MSVLGFPSNLAGSGALAVGHVPLPSTNNTTKVEARSVLMTDAAETVS